MKEKNPFQAAVSAYRRMFAIVLGFSAAIGILMFVGPVYMMQVYDRVLPSGDVATLVSLTLIAFALMAAHGILDYARARIVARCGARFDAAIAGPLFKRVLQSSVTNPRGNARHAMTDALRLRDFLMGTGIVAFCELPFALVFLAVCFLIHPWIGAVSLAGAVVLLVLAVINERMTRSTSGEMQLQSAESQGLAAQIVSDAREVRATGLEVSLVDHWRGLHRRSLKAQSHAGERAAPMATLSRQFRLALQTAILGTGAYLAIQKEITPGVMIAASVMSGRALAPLDSIIAQWKQIGAARQAYRRIRVLFGMIPEEAGNGTALAPSGRIEAVNLALGAGGAREILVQGLRFAIEPGEVVAIAGSNGSGKSTVLRALAGVGDVVGGEILIDGLPMKRCDANSMAAEIGYLPQRARLFSGTIAQNIAGFRDMTPLAIVEAARMAGAEAMVSNLPDGFDTKVSPDTPMLSEGLVQRIALARAVAGDPRLLLLDEPQSFLDADGRRALVSLIQACREIGRSVVIVTQDVRLQTLTDKSVILGQRRMLAFGLTADLMRPAAAPDAPSEAAASSAAGARLSSLATA